MTAAKALMISKWFIPTLGEMLLALDTLAQHPELSDFSITDPAANNNKGRYFYSKDTFIFNEDFGTNLWEPLFTRAGVKDNMPRGKYWLMTEGKEDNKAWMWATNGLNFFELKNKAEKYRVRPVVAFALELPGN